MESVSSGSGTSGAAVVATVGIGAAALTGGRGLAALRPRGCPGRLPPGGPQRSFLRSEAPCSAMESLSATSAPRCSRWLAPAGLPTVQESERPATASPPAAMARSRSPCSARSLATASMSRLPPGVFSVPSRSRIFLARSYHVPAPPRSRCSNLTRPMLYSRVAAFIVSRVRSASWMPRALSNIFRASSRLCSRRGAAPGVSYSLRNATPSPS
mmetsp:Transcript_55646/g.156673  ORF Transcript_55646/g.156673 Transcript_55646/m.156673 type:complete len:213 (+) Transcript_55646:209-847(+)